MIALAVAAAMAAGLPAKLAPIDQCRGDDSFALFRETLASAAAREDAEAVKALMAPGLRGAPGAEDDWPRLRMLLRMGCARDGEARIIPSTPRQLKAYSGTDKYLTLPGADLLASTDDPNSIVEGAVLKWDVVTATNVAGHIWTGVRLADGRNGFIRDSDLYSLGHPSWIRVERRGEQWMITEIE